MKYFLCNLVDNIRTSHYNKKWFSKYNEVECIICGETLNSNETKANPREYGWWYCKSKESGRQHGFWICHTCNGHHNEHWKWID